MPSQFEPYVDSGIVSHVNCSVLLASVFSFAEATQSFCNIFGDNLISIWIF